MLLLNLSAVASYLLIGWRFGYIGNLQADLYSQADSQGYLEIAQWLESGQGEAPGATRVRPLLYPLLLVAIRALTLSATGVWLVQAALWFATINVTALCCYQLTKKPLMLIFAFVLMASNLSLSALTYYALTETLTVFMLAALLFLLCQTSLTHLSPRTAFSIVLILGLLTILRPVFKIHLVALLIILVMRKRQDMSALLAIALACVPVISQMLFMKVVHDQFMISQIGSSTLQEYYLSKLYALESEGRVHTEREYLDGLVTVKQYQGLEVATYVLKTFPTSAWVFFENVFWQNLLNASSFTRNSALLTRFSEIMNWFYCLLHLLFLPLVVRTLMRRLGEFRLKLIVLYSSFGLMVLATGISFWQGDRLIAPSLPLWLGAYSLVCSNRALK